ISLQRGSEQTAELNARFANEQTLAAEHAWLFLAGRGLISLHVGEEVFAFFAERGDLLVVPAGMAHWVSLGAERHCLAVRLAPEGMAPEDTGEAIAGRFSGVEHYCCLMRAAGVSRAHRPGRDHQRCAALGLAAAGVAGRPRGLAGRRDRRTDRRGHRVRIRRSGLRAAPPRIGGCPLAGRAAGLRFGTERNRRPEKAPTALRLQAESIS